MSAVAVLAASGQPPDVPANQARPRASSRQPEIFGSNVGDIGARGVRAQPRDAAFLRRRVTTFTAGELGGGDGAERAGAGRGGRDSLGHQLRSVDESEARGPAG